VKFTEQPLIIHWWDAIKMLREAGHEVTNLSFRLVTISEFDGIG
jgi:hypothetical protein